MIKQYLVKLFEGYRKILSPLLASHSKNEDIARREFTLNTILLVSLIFILFTILKVIIDSLIGEVSILVIPQ